MLRAARVQRMGFTLIEIMVALLIGGGVLLLASSIASVSSNVAEAVQQSVEAEDARQGSERLLRRLVGQMTWAMPGDPAVGGASHELLFMTWCDTSHGWQERCEAQLQLTTDEGHLGVLVILGGREEMKLFPADTVVALIYLASAARGGVWSEKWTDPTSFPEAIGLVFPTDTLVARIGERG